MQYLRELGDTFGTHKMSKNPHGKKTNEEIMKIEI